MDKSLRWKVFLIFLSQVKFGFFSLLLLLHSGFKLHAKAEHNHQCIGRAWKLARGDIPPRHKAGRREISCVPVIKGCKSFPPTESQEKKRHCLLVTEGGKAVYTLGELMFWRSFVAWKLIEQVPVWSCLRIPLSSLLFSFHGSCIPAPLKEGKPCHDFYDKVIVCTFERWILKFANFEIIPYN